MDLKYYLKLWGGLFKYRKKIVTDKYDSVLAIDYESLKERGVKLLVFDFDETLTDFHGSLSHEVETLLKNLLNTGFKIAIHSNFSPNRKQELFSHFENYSIFVSEKSNKPNPNGYIEILNKQNTSNSDTTIIGDRIGTDLFGGFLAGYKYRIFVEAYSTIYKGKSAPFKIRVLKKLENFFFS